MNSNITDRKKLKSISKECRAWPVDFAQRYRDKGYWRGQTLGEMLRVNAINFGCGIAVVDGSRRLSYADLDNQSDSLVTGLMSQGIRPGDRVIIQMSNCLEFIEISFALFKLGALPVFALPGHRLQELSHFVTVSEATAYIVTDTINGFDYRELARNVKSKRRNLKVFVVGDSAEFQSFSVLYGNPQFLSIPMAEDVALFQLSGGTTGASKLIPRTHDDYLYSIRASVDICKLDKSSVYMTVLPIAHNFSMSSPGFLGTLFVGGRVILTSLATPEECFSQIDDHSVTITALVPALAVIWLSAAERRSANSLSSLRIVQVGGANFPHEIAKQIQPAFGCVLQQVFGMAEGLVSYTRLDDDEYLTTTTQGYPISLDDEIKIVDNNDNYVPTGVTGQLLTRGPYTIRGYYRAPEHDALSFTSDGFYRTGDLVSQDQDGYLTVAGRLKDQINKGGEKISPSELENLLVTHHSIREAAVIAVPDTILGERICAFIVSTNANVTGTEVKKFVLECGFAIYKIPDIIKFVDYIPRTPVGKPDKRKLAEKAAYNTAK